MVVLEVFFGPANATLTFVTQRHRYLDVLGYRAGVPPYDALFTYWFRASVGAGPQNIKNLQSHSEQKKNEQCRSHSMPG